MRAKIFGKFRNRTRKLMGQMDQYQEAITFAEAGQPEHVKELLMADEDEENNVAKLLRASGRERALFPVRSSTMPLRWLSGCPMKYWP